MPISAPPYRSLTAEAARPSFPSRRRTSPGSGDDRGRATAAARNAPENESVGSASAASRRRRDAKVVPVRLPNVFGQPVASRSAALAGKRRPRSTPSWASPYVDKILACSLAHMAYGGRPRGVTDWRGCGEGEAGVATLPSGREGGAR